MKNAVICPVCYGKGFVPNGFYRGTGLTWVTNDCSTEQCRSCKGKGYVIVQRRRIRNKGVIKR